MVDMSSKGFFAGIFREIIASIDSFIYKLLAGIYNVFFNVATAEVLQASMMKNLFSRVQLILGVIILFKLVISFFTGVVNPDGFSDEKKGFGGVIKRIITVLIMLLMIVPLNIPESSQGNSGMGSWNKKMNTHGILFGTLYEVQKRVLNENLIFKLINGNTLGEEEDYSDKDKIYENRKSAGEQFSVDVLKTFIMPNVIEDGASFDDECAGKQDETECVCWYTNGSSDKDDVKLAMKVYFSKDATIDQLLSEDVITAFCRDVSTKAEKMEDKWEHAYYALAYSKLWSTIVGVLFCALMLSLTVDVAVRVFKLALLQIISPMAILSYIDPAGEKTFKNWTKALTETYLSVFIRVAIISFALFIINNFSLTGFGLERSNGFVGFVSKILLYFGLIMFAKEAPKYITQTLGIENKDNTGLFSGLGKIVSSAAGGISTGLSAFRASQKADEKFAAGSQNSFKNRAKAVATGLVTGTGAAIGNATTYDDAKNHKWRSAMDKVNKANTFRMQNAEEGGTWWGQKKDQLRQDFLGDSRYSELKRQEKDYKDRQEKYNKGVEAIKKLDTAAENEAVNKGLRTNVKLGNKTLLNTNMKDLDAIYEKGKATGKFTFAAGKEQTFNNANDLQAALERALANGSKEKGYEFAGYRYSNKEDLMNDYNAAYQSGQSGRGYVVEGATLTASQFGAARADALDYTKNTIYNGTAQFADGAKYTASVTLQNNITNASSIMSTLADDSLIMQLGEQHNKQYKESNDMVTNMKNMKDLMNASSDMMTGKIEGMQSQIGRAQTNFRGTDGGQGNK